MEARCEFGGALAVGRLKQRPQRPYRREMTFEDELKRNWGLELTTRIKPGGIITIEPCSSHTGSQMEAIL